MKDEVEGGGADGGDRAEDGGEGDRAEGLQGRRGLGARWRAAAEAEDQRRTEGDGGQEGRRRAEGGEQMEGGGRRAEAEGQRMAQEIVEGRTGRRKQQPEGWRARTGRRTADSRRAEGRRARTGCRRAEGQRAEGWRAGRADRPQQPGDSALRVPPVIGSCAPSAKRFVGVASDESADKLPLVAFASPSQPPLQHVSQRHHPAHRATRRAPPPS